MATLTLSLEKEFVEIAQTWEDTSKKEKKNDKREFVQVVCRFEHAVSNLIKRLENNPFLFGEKELKRRLYLISDHLDIVSDYLDNLESAILISEKENDLNLLKEFKLYKKAVKSLEEKLEKLILLATKLEIKYFYQRETEAFSRI
jgi:hypothetical protein